MPKRLLRWLTLPACAGAGRGDGPRCLRPEGWCCDEPADFAGSHCVFWLPAPAYRTWVRAFGPTMKIPCVWASRANEVPLCVLRGREAPAGHLDAVSVIHPDDDPG